MNTVSRAFLALAMTLVVANATSVWGQNGTIQLSAAHCQSGAAVVGSSDLTYDDTPGNAASDDIYALDLGTGQICRYEVTSFPAAITSVGTVANPFGGAGFPPTNTSVGIAHDPTGDGGAGSLWVLNTSSMNGIRIWETDKLGTPIGVAVTVATPAMNSAPSGLTYDPSNGSLWYRDTTGNLLVNIDTAGTILTTIAIPGVSSDSLAFGSSLHYSEFAGDRFITITFGDVIDFRVVETIKIDIVSGQRTPEIVDLSQLYDSMVGGDADAATNPITGIVLPPVGTVYYVSTQNTIYSVDAIQPSVFPPTELVCRSRTDGLIELSWVNNGSGVPSGANDNYVNVQINRVVGNTDSLVDSLPGSSMDYLDTAVTDPLNPQLLNTVLDYRVTGIDSSGMTAEAICSVRTGVGALLGFEQFDGVLPYDMAYDAVNNELYVTDNTDYGGATPGRIYVYDSDLTLIRTLNTAIRNVRGIVLNTGDDPADSSDDLLYISAGLPVQLTQLRLIDPMTGAELSSLPIDSPSIGEVQIGAITYDSASRDYLVIDEVTGFVERFEAEDNGMVSVQPTPGTYLGTCVAPFTSYSRGITFLDSGNYLATIQGMSPGQVETEIQEFDANTCLNPTPTTPIPLSEIGGSLTEPDAINGLLAIGNVLYVANAETNSIFRLLLAPAVDFIRGDANGDMMVDAADVLAIANYLFLSGGAVPGCLDSADVNDDGMVDISDATYLLFYLFVTGSPMPPAPFPGLGPDVTFLDGLGC